MLSSTPKLDQKFFGSCGRSNAALFSDNSSLPSRKSFPSNRVPAFPITPPATKPDREFAADDGILPIATHVLETEAKALVALSRLYATDQICRDGFSKAVEVITESQRKNGKTIVIGVGKSGKVGDKFVASMNSLGLFTILLNPTDALHGDLGIIKENDVFLLITFSGKTPELLQLLPYLPAQLPLIALTSHTSYHTSPLLQGRECAILLPAPIPESEIASFGLSAPTTSTTVAMALGDALALSTAARMYNVEGAGPKEVFQKNHPGGAIGQVNKASSETILGRMRNMVVMWEDIPIIDAMSSGRSTPAMSESSSDSELDQAEWNSSLLGEQRDTKGLRVVDCLRFAVKSLSGWLQTSNGGLIPPKKLMNTQNVMAEIHDPALGLVMNIHEQLKVPADALVKDIARMLCSKRTRGEIDDETIVVVFDGTKILGVVEVASVVERAGLV
ncbi:hypothetical protein EDC01DRAFT_617245 [Geopyxis carbonaria]|nr:hypothetical protein EDC01DRAFT_617245 [Geopyxis carbonaria]